MGVPFVFSSMFVHVGRGASAPLGGYEVVKVRWAFRRIWKKAIWEFEISEFGFEIRNSQSEIRNRQFCPFSVGAKRRCQDVGCGSITRASWR